ncbi:MAG: hypothetical protein F6K17_41855 [Okeania sp. SIO3C4]|nr:hypothetical protein [Okeania sp. SIO3C4]
MPTSVLPLTENVIFFMAAASEFGVAVMKAKSAAKKSECLTGAPLGFFRIVESRMDQGTAPILEPLALFLEIPALWI